MKESAHQGKPEERSRRLGDNGVIVTENYRVRDTRQPKMYPSSFLASLSRFENSQNVKMTSFSGKLHGGGESA